MLISVTVFSLLKNKYLVTPDGKQIGLAPAKSELMKEKNANEEVKEVKNSPLRLIGCIIAAIALYFYFSYDSSTFNDYISAAIYAISIIMPIFIITDKSLTKTELSRIGVIYIIAVFVIFFWSAFEQAGMTLTYFAQYQTDRTIFGWEMPTSWFQSFNPIFVVTLAPIMAALWQFLGKRNAEPSSPIKQAIGLMLLAIGYLVITIGVNGAEDGNKVSMFWLAGLYCLHTIGELALSPIGLSMVNKLSPARFASLLMGIWFLSNAASNILAANLATLYPTTDANGNIVTKSLLGIEIATMSDFFMVFVVMAGAASILLFSLCPLLKKMMKGVE
jgi:POT family proton-dependent oligopeptide transporter